MKFVTAGGLKSELGLSPEMKQMSLKVNKDIAIEQTNVFSLEEIRNFCDLKVAEHSKNLGVDFNDFHTAVIMALLSQGTARNKLNGNIMVYFGTKVKEYTKLSSEGDGVIDIGVFLREVSDFATTKYKDIKLSKNTANGGKLYLRCYSNQTFVFLESMNSVNIYSNLKIAQKTAIRSNKLAILCNPAFPDIEEVSKADAIAFLKIMANYMKRSRSGKNSKDVNGDEINKKDIFLSLASRLYISHPEAGVLNNSDLDKYWEDGKVPNENDPDLASVYYDGKDRKTLAQLIGNHSKGMNALTSKKPSTSSTSTSS